MHEVAKLILENFQGHASSTIEPGGPGTLTVITGPTDAGKSAIFRALRWAYYNTPSGDGFKRVGTDHVSVTVQTVGGRAITRRRTATTNRYIVDGEVLEGFGNSVPLEVQEATGVRPLRLADQELRVNLAHQKDPDFLGAGTSGPARAKALGILGGTEILDRANRDLGTDLYRWREQAKGMEAQIISFEDQLRQYAHLSRLEEILNRLEAIQLASVMLNERLSRLALLREQLKQIEMAQIPLKVRLEQLRGVPEAAQYVQHALLHNGRLGQLQSLTDQLKRLNEERQQAAEIIARTNNTPWAAQHLHWATEHHEGLKRVWAAHLKWTAVLTGIEELSWRLDHLKAVEPATSYLKAAAEAAERRRLLAKASADYHDTQALIDLTRERIGGISVILQEINLGPVIAVMQRLGHLLPLARNLTSTIHEIQTTAARKEALEHAFPQLQAEYRQALLDAGTCPTCGSPINPEHLRLLKEVI